MLLAGRIVTSLGENARFVNISPADYNSEETTTSLQYAQRVKMITNDASKAQVCMPKEPYKRALLHSKETY